MSDRRIAPSGASVSALTALEARLGHRFHDQELLELALTHRSRAGEGAAQHNERLEFLGDAVLGMLAVEWLYRNYAGDREGELARRKSALVSERMLARRARELDLGAVLRLAAGEEKSGGRDKDSLLADCYEAVIGALFLDGGISAVQPVVAAALERSSREPDVMAAQDAKTRLQELLQAARRSLPEYRLVEQHGPDHERTYVFECWIDGRLVGGGSGPTKKIAEQQAALAALETMERESAVP